MILKIMRLDVITKVISVARKEKMFKDWTRGTSKTEKLERWGEAARETEKGAASEVRERGEERDQSCHWCKRYWWAKSDKDGELTIAFSNTEVIGYLHYSSFSGMFGVKTHGRGFLINWEKLEVFEKFCYKERRDKGLKEGGITLRACGSGGVVVFSGHVMD